MSKSPLSGAFSGSAEPAKKKNKKNGAILLIAGVALASSIGGVFAANSITIANVEFGQGVADTVSCTENATTNLTQEYVSGEFYVDVVTLGTVSDCSAVDVVVSLLDASGTVLHATTAGAGPAAAGTVTFDLSGLSTRIVASDVAKITVTTE
jgi:hypothetical protein